MLALLLTLALACSTTPDTGFSGYNSAICPTGGELVVPVARLPIYAWEAIDSPDYEGTAGPIDWSQTEGDLTIYCYDGATVYWRTLGG